MKTELTEKFHFSIYFEKVLKEQFILRQELIGQQITAIYYTPKVEGWEIEIKDENVIHLPLGYLTIETESKNIYKIDTNYQSFCGGLFGIMIHKLTTNASHNPLIYPLVNYLSIDKRWEFLKSNSICDISWNWKRGLLKVDEGRTISLNQAKKYIFEDCFVPESLTIHFTDNKILYLFALEPDGYLNANNSYNLISCGEELMIFIGNIKLKDWGISNIGFQIEPT